MKGNPRVIEYLQKEMGVTKIRFPNITKEQEAAGIKLLEAELPRWDLSLTLDETVREGMLSILLTPTKESAGIRLPYVVMSSGGRTDTAKFEKGESSSTWYTLRLPSGTVRSVITVISRDTATSWSGKGAFWLVCQQETKGREITLTATSPVPARPMPPRAANVTPMPRCA